MRNMYIAQVGLERGEGLVCTTWWARTKEDMNNDKAQPSPITTLTSLYGVPKNVTDKYRDAHILGTLGVLQGCCQPLGDPQPAMCTCKGVTQLYGENTARLHEPLVTLPPNVLSRRVGPHQAPMRGALPINHPPLCATCISRRWAWRGERD